MTDKRNDPYLIAILKQLFDDLQFMKKQQWMITNYSIALLVAIYYIKKNQTFDHSYLKILVIVIAIASLSLLIRIQNDIARSRLRIEIIDGQFPEVKVGHTEQEINNSGQENCCAYIRRFMRGFEFTSALITTLIVGAAFVYFSLK